MSSSGKGRVLRGGASSLEMLRAIGNTPVLIFLCTVGLPAVGLPISGFPTRSVPVSGVW